VQNKKGKQEQKGGDKKVLNILTFSVRQRFTLA
jgi:hypothetical protein